MQLVSVVVGVVVCVAFPGFWLPEIGNYAIQVVIKFVLILTMMIMNYEYKCIYFM